MKKTAILLTTVLTSVLLSASLAIAPVQAASASFSTKGGGSVNTGNQVSVTVAVNGSEAYNAVSVTVNYSNLTFISASATGGWTGVSGPSNSGGNVSFSGALLGSSANGSRNVLTLRFRAPNNPGSATVKSSGKISLANGSGTQVSGGGNTITYNIKEPPPPPPSGPGKVDVSSSTHPDQNAWYSNQNLNLSWNKASGVSGFSYELNTTPNTNPDDILENADTAASFTLDKEGANYFHIKAKNSVGFGEVTHFAVQFDITKPYPFGIAKLLNVAGDKYLIYFATNDAISNIASYTVTVDGVDMGQQKTAYEIPLTAKGVDVGATDQAGNLHTEKLVLAEGVTGQTESEPASTPVNSPNSAGINWLLVCLGICGLMIMILGIIILIIFLKRRKAPLLESDSL